MCSDDDPVAQLDRALDRLVDADPGVLAGGDAVVALSRQLARLEAVAARASAAFERRGEWRADGARTADAWLAVRCREPVGTARRRVALGRVLPGLPVVEAAGLAGGVGSSAVELLARARTEATAAALREDEAKLVGHARTLHPRAFARVVAYWRQLADPDGAEEEAAALHEARHLHLSSSFQGRWFLDGVLDPVGGEVVATALARIDEELFRADWAEARAQHGELASVDRLARTPATAAGRRPGGAGPPGHGCPRRGSSRPSAAVHRARRPRDPPRAHLRAGSLPHRGGTGRPGAVAQRGPRRAGRLRRGRARARRRPSAAVLLRCRAPGRRGAGPGVHVALLRGACRGLRGRPRGPGRRGRPDPGRERPAGVRVPQPLVGSTTTLTPSGCPNPVGAPAGARARRRRRGARGPPPPGGLRRPRPHGLSGAGPPAPNGGRGAGPRSAARRRRGPAARQRATRRAGPPLRPPRRTRGTGRPRAARPSG